MEKPTVDGRLQHNAENDGIRSKSTFMVCELVVCFTLPLWYFNANTHKSAWHDAREQPS